MKKIELDNFYDFSTGVQIGESEIKNWLEEIREELMNSDKEEDSSSISSGNTMVIGFKYDDQYSFVVTNSYKSFDYFDVNKPLNEITFK